MRLRARRAPLLLAPAVVAGAMVLVSLRCNQSDSAQAADGGTDALPDRSLHPPDYNYIYPADVQEAPDTGTCSPEPSADGLVHDWPGYTRVTQLDKCAPIDTLDDLSQAMPYAWVPCTNDAGGCLRFDAPLADRDLGYYIGGAAVRDASGHGVRLMVTRARLAPDDHLDEVVYSLVDGTVLGSWRAVTGYSVSSGLLTSASGANGLLIADFDANSFGHPIGVVTSYGPVPFLWASPPVGTQRVLADTYTNVAFSSTNRLTLEYQYNDYRIITCDLASHAGACVNANLAAVAPARILLDFVEGDVLYAESPDGTLGWTQEYVIDVTGKPSLLRARPNTHVSAMATDGTSLVWTETQGPADASMPQATSEVWSAPLTSDPQQLALTAKKVATLPKAGYGGVGTVFNGYYTVSMADGFIYRTFVVRLSDGAVVEAPPAPGSAILDRNVYVTSSEVWQAVKSPSDLVRLQLPWP